MFNNRLGICSRLTFTKSESRDSLQDATTAIFQRGGTLNPSVSVCIREVFEDCLKGFISFRIERKHNNERMN